MDQSIRNFNISRAITWVRNMFGICSWTILYSPGQNCAPTPETYVGETSSGKKTKQNKTRTLENPFVVPTNSTKNKY